jgi:hypothetical protein
VPGGGQLVVKRVVEKVASIGLTNYLILTKSNYNHWGLWGTVDPGGTEF